MKDELKLHVSPPITGTRIWVKAGSEPYGYGIWITDDDGNDHSLDDLLELKKKYGELILAVESKRLNESRHETALRYIREREFLPRTDGEKSDG